MNLRHLKQQDLPALLSLYAHLHVSDMPMPSASEVEAVWAEIQANDRIRYFGVFVNDQLVSSCTIAVIPNLTRGCRPYAVIENVVTHSAHRKHGYGNAILQSALTYAWSAGCYKAMLLTGRKDEEILRFYQSAGFDPNSKQAFVAKLDDAALAMERRRS
ncbi:GNAT family N-acetyltransferase [Methylophilus flavus]|uniref:GNAT family N-acetyltransferase n=1 Tax=Methylophilus flavus TaxID=640084 RepID=A0ABW3PB88_9PROT